MRRTTDDRGNPTGQPAGPAYREADYLASGQQHREVIDLDRYPGEPISDEAGEPPTEVPC